VLKCPFKSPRLERVDCLAFFFVFLLQAFSRSARLKNEPWHYSHSPRCPFKHSCRLGAKAQRNIENTKCEVDRMKGCREEIEGRTGGGGDVWVQCELRSQWKTLWRSAVREQSLAIKAERTMLGVSENHKRCQLVSSATPSLLYSYFDTFLQDMKAST